MEGIKIIDSSVIEVEPESEIDIEKLAMEMAEKETGPILAQVDKQAVIEIYKRHIENAKKQADDAFHNFGKNLGGHND